MFIKHGLLNDNKKILEFIPLILLINHNIIMTNRIIVGICVFLFFQLADYQCLANDPQKWKVGTYSGVLNEINATQLNELEDLGFELIELGVSYLVGKPIEEQKEWISHINEVMDSSGLKIWSIHIPFGKSLDISSVDENDRQRIVKELISLIDLCSNLRPSKYIIHPSAEPIADSERKIRMEKSITSLKELNKFVKDKGANLAVECLPRTCLGNSSDEILYLVNSIGDGIEVCFDTNHLLKEKPEIFASKVGKYISTVHISDYDGIDERHWIPGRGIIDWGKVLDELIKCGYKGPWMFEVVPRNNPEMEISNLYQSWLKILSDYENIK